MDKRVIAERLKNIKHKQAILCFAALALVLVIYFLFASCSGAESTATSAPAAVDGDYCTAMQARVEGIVSQISGVGAASVVINWDRSVSAAFSGGAENPRAVGVLVVCDGGANTKVKLDVIYAVSTLLDISIEKIMVYPKSK